MNFQLNSQRYRVFLNTLLVGLTITSCGGGGTQNENSEETICNVSLTQVTSSANESMVSYAGQLPTDCQKKITELSGRAEIYLTAQTKTSTAAIALQELKVGQRDLQFNAASDNFLRGTYEKRFDSSFYPAWTLPWKDNPSVVTLSMAVTDQNLITALPPTVKVEFLY